MTEEMTEKTEVETSQTIEDLKKENIALRKEIIIVQKKLNSLYIAAVGARSILNTSINSIEQV